MLSWEAGQFHSHSRFSSSACLLSPDRQSRLRDQHANAQSESSAPSYLEGMFAPVKNHQLTMKSDILTARPRSMILAIVVGGPAFSDGQRSIVAIHICPSNKDKLIVLRLFF